MRRRRRARATTDLPRALAAAPSGVPLVASISYAEPAAQGSTPPLLPPARPPAGAPPARARQDGAGVRRRRRGDEPGDGGPGQHVRLGPTRAGGGCAGPALGAAADDSAPLPAERFRLPPSRSPPPPPLQVRARRQEARRRQHPRAHGAHALPAEEGQGACAETGRGRERERLRSRPSSSPRSRALSPTRALPPLLFFLAIHTHLRPTPTHPSRFPPHRTMFVPKRAARRRPVAPRRATTPSPPPTPTPTRHPRTQARICKIYSGPVPEAEATFDLTEGGIADS